MSPPRHIVISDGVLAVLAGSDTTSSVLSNLFWCILQRPDIYKRLRAEVDHYYPPGEDSLDGKHLGDMRYLEAVMHVPELSIVVRALTLPYYLVMKRCDSGRRF